MARKRGLLPGAALTAALWISATPAAGAAVVNLTGLPAYPNLDSGGMDPYFKTETYGRWCAKFTAESSDSLATVEAWYRKSLIRASETDLLKDNQYNYRPQLSGIKLALGIDYVAVYRTSAQETIIELHRCSWTR